MRIPGSIPTRWGLDGRFSFPCPTRNDSNGPSGMKALRRIHLYLGCFFAPVLLFFVVSGWYQTMNPDRRKGPGEAEAIADRMRSVHADSLLPSAEASGYST